MVVKFDEDELIEHWTLVGDELRQVAGKRGATRLGLALLLKFYARHGRFPRGCCRTVDYGAGAGAVDGAICAKDAHRPVTPDMKM